MKKYIRNTGSTIRMPIPLAEIARYVTPLITDEKKKSLISPNETSMDTRRELKRCFGGYWHCAVCGLESTLTSLCIEIDTMPKPSKHTRELHAVRSSRTVCLRL